MRTQNYDDIIMYSSFDIKKKSEVSGFLVLDLLAIAFVTYAELSGMTDHYVDILGTVISKFI